MRDYIDRNAAAALLGMSRHYMEKHKGRPGFPRLQRYGRKVWYKRVDVQAWAERLRLEQHRGPSGRDLPPDPPDEELAAAFDEAPADASPEVTAMLTIARKMGTEPSPQGSDPLARVDEWPSGLYETPYGVLIRRKT